ncbi:lipopolysaccharide biosynthesis protein [Ekhidna sp.]|uniref:lipopolysaccharide biosynthesis protein n=1 Tax=Ekhidna sp. TaxID=2608089 RepID=UPI003B4FFF31
MGVVIKQSFWGTVIAYLGVIVGYVNTLYFRAEFFDLEQIGLFTLITSHAMIVSPVSSFGMGNSYIKFFPAFQTKNKHRFFSFLFLITVIGNAIILTAGYFMKNIIASRYIESAPDYINYLSITAIIIVSNSFFDLFFNYGKTIMKVLFPSFLRDIYLRFGSLLLVIGYAINWWNFDSAIVGLGVVYFSAFLFLLIQLLIFGFRFDFRIGIINGEWRYKLLKFGSYSMLMAGTFALINNVSYDQITAILGPEMNGIFTTCFFIALIVEMPKRNMAKVITPILSSELEKNNFKEVSQLYKRSSITMSIIGMLIFIGIVTNLQDLLNFIPKGDEFQKGFWVVIGVCLAKLVLMVSSFSGEIISYSKLYKYNLLFQALAAILLIALNYFLIPKYGLNGAVTSYLLTITIHVFVKMLFIKYHFDMYPFIKTHLPLIAIGLIIVFLAFTIQPNLHPVINIVIRSILTALIFTLLIYRFKISEDINKIIHSTFERFLKINLPK